VVRLNPPSCLIIECNFGKLRNFFDKGSGSSVFKDIVDFPFHGLLESKRVESGELRA